MDAAIINGNTAATGDSTNANRDTADTELSNNVEKLNHIVKMLMRFIHQQRKALTIAYEPTYKNNNHVIANIEKCASSAQSIVFAIDGTELRSDSEDISIDEEHTGPNRAGKWSPALTLQTRGTSITELFNSAHDDSKTDIKLDIIQRLRDTANQLWKENRYTEAKTSFKLVLRRSERKYGNEFKWKDDTIKSLAIINCTLHQWNDVEESIKFQFVGREEVIRALTREYAVEGRLNEAVRILHY